VKKLLAETMIPNFEMPKRRKNAKSSLGQQEHYPLLQLGKNHDPPFYIHGNGGGSVLTQSRVLDRHDLL
jgi:hypothetical protein